MEQKSFSSSQAWSFSSFPKHNRENLLLDLIRPLQPGNKQNLILFLLKCFGWNKTFGIKELGFKETWRSTEFQLERPTILLRELTNTTSTKISTPILSFKICICFGFLCLYLFRESTLHPQQFWVGNLLPHFIFENLYLLWIFVFV